MYTYKLYSIENCLSPFFFASSALPVVQVPPASDATRDGPAAAGIILDVDKPCSCGPKHQLQMVKQLQGGAPVR